jgi:hypothetical protein
MYRDGTGPAGDDEGTRNSFFPENRPRTLHDLQVTLGREIADLVMSFGREYTNDGVIFWLAEDLVDLVPLADMELRQEHERLQQE